MNTLVKKVVIGIILILLLASLVASIFSYLRVSSLGQSVANLEQATSNLDQTIADMGQDIDQIRQDTDELNGEVDEMQLGISRLEYAHPLLFESDEEGTGFCEVSQLISFKGKLYAFIAPKGHIVAIDPATQKSEIVYEHPYVRPDKWRATAWGAYVTEEGALFFAGWGSDEQQQYCSYIFKSTDGENFTAIKLGVDSEAYSIVEFENDDLGIKKLFVFVADFTRNENDETETVVFAADPDGESWSEVYRFPKNYKIGGAIEWYGHLWAAGSDSEPGMPTSNGVIVHYDPYAELDADPETEPWEYFTYDVGFYAIGRYFIGPERMVVLGDTDGWLWVTYTMPPPQNKDRRLIKLDAPIMRINQLGDWHFGNSSQLLVSTGLRWGWGSLWLIDSSVFAHQLVQNAYGGITAFTPLYNGIAYGTSWDLPGCDYDVRPHALGGLYSPSASVDFITPKEVAEQSGEGREPLRHVVSWQEGDKEEGRVKANALSEIIPGVGWRELILNFTADAEGTLTIETDAGVEPENSHWLAVKTINVSANQPIAEKLEIWGTRYRIQFSATAKISAVVYLYST